LLDALFDAFHADLQVGKIPANYSQTKIVLVRGYDKKNSITAMQLILLRIYSKKDGIPQN
ncbi:MAG: hypothetical protein KA735_15450, partial [Burkholderiaceae bacterium]|nr:hypothetical protein [Burkholderiaceae bacterium]